MKMSIEPDITVTVQENNGISLVNELKRKGFHFLSTAIPIGYFLTSYNTALWTLGGLLALAILIEYARLSHSAINRFFHRIFGNMLRDTESFHYSGATYLLISSFLVIMVFHKEIAILCLLFLTLGDGTAAIVGKSFGHTKVFTKTLEGTLAFIIVSVGVGFFFGQIPFFIRLAGAAVAAIVELLPMRTSDNLRIPIVSGSVMELLLLSYLQSQNTPTETDGTVVSIDYIWISLLFS